MARTAATGVLRTGEPPPLGKLIKRWRAVRGVSQLALALESGFSARHLSFIESGRTRPSRRTVLALARTLRMPLRDRNDLLEVAGYARVFGESSLAASELAPVRRAIELIMAHQEPWPAVVMDRHWNRLEANDAARRFFGLLLGGAPPTSDQPVNVVRMMFHPQGLRPFVENWEEVAAALLQRIRDEAVGGILDEAHESLIDEVLAYPGVPANLAALGDQERPGPLVLVRFAKEGRRYSFFSAVTTLGTPRDVTLQEIRIECFFPADEATRASASDWAQGRDAGPKLAPL